MSKANHLTLVQEVTDLLIEQGRYAQMSNKQIKFFDVLLYIGLVTIIILGVWFAIAWYTYPCEAFQSGIMRNQQLPGRCVVIKEQL